MNVKVIWETQMPPVKEVVLTLTRQEAVIVRELCNWSSAVADFVSKKSISINVSDTDRLLTSIWRELHQQRM